MIPWLRMEYIQWWFGKRSDQSNWCRLPTVIQRSRLPMTAPVPTELVQAGIDFWRRSHCFPSRVIYSHSDFFKDVALNWNPTPG